MSAQPVARAARLLVYTCAVALVVIPGPSLRAQNGGASKASNGAAAAPIEPNYELAAQWTSQKIGKLVFDTTVNAALAREERSLLVRLPDPRGPAILLRRSR